MANETITGVGSLNPKDLVLLRLLTRGGSVSYDDIVTAFRALGYSATETSIKQALHKVRKAVATYGAQLDNRYRMGWHIAANRGMRRRLREDVQRTSKTRKMRRLCRIRTADAGGEARP